MSTLDNPTYLDISDDFPDTPADELSLANYGTILGISVVNADKQNAYEVIIRDRNKAQQIVKFIMEWLNG